MKGKKPSQEVVATMTSSAILMAAGKAVAVAIETAQREGKAVSVTITLQVQDK